MPTIKYYSHFTIMPNKRLLTYKFRASFSKQPKAPALSDINSASSVFGLNYEEMMAAPNGWKVVN